MKHFDLVCIVETGSLFVDHLDRVVYLTDASALIPRSALGLPTSVSLAPLLLLWAIVGRYSLRTVVPREYGQINIKMYYAVFLCSYLFTLHSR